MKPGLVSCPRCFAPAGEPCVTQRGITRPVHAERFEKAKLKSEESIMSASAYDLAAGLEDSEVRSMRFEENEAVPASPEHIEALAESAIEQLMEIIEAAEVDDTTGEVVINARTPEGVEISERLHSLAELRTFLREFGFNSSEESSSQQEWEFGYGGPIRLLRREIDAVLEESDAANLFKSIKLEGTTLFRVQPGILIPEFKIEVASVNEELIRYLAKKPEDLYSLAPRKFEELVEAIFRDFGYEVLLGPRGKDGGVDLRAIRKDSLGQFLCLIQCKRHAPHRPVRVDIVRSLHGVAESEKASCGLVVTTSHFSREAREFADLNKYKMSLRDYNDLVGWLKHYPTAKRR
jgi:restriction endonuclease